MHSTGLNFAAIEAGKMNVKKNRSANSQAVDTAHFYVDRKTGIITLLQF
jgi:hypothetical protein